MLDEMGIACGVNLDALLEAAEAVRETIPHPLNSALLKAGKPWVLAKAPDCQIKLG
jgi:hypothetical protein